MAKLSSVLICAWFQHRATATIYAETGIEQMQFSIRVVQPEDLWSVQSAGLCQIKFLLSYILWEMTWKNPSELILNEVLTEINFLSLLLQ